MSFRTNSILKLIVKFIKANEYPRITQKFNKLLGRVKFEEYEIKWNEMYTTNISIA